MPQLNLEQVKNFSENGWFTTQELLSIKESQELFYWIKHRENTMSPARIGSLDQKSKQTSIRSDSILWIEPENDPVFKVWNQKINEITESFKENFYLAIKGSEFHFAHYTQGSFYARHIDQPKSSHNRIISVVHYLNPEWNSAWGGQIVLYPENQNPVQIEPKSPTTLFFQSHKLAHEVLKTKKDRFTLTGWLLG